MRVDEPRGWERVGARIIAFETVPGGLGESEVEDFDVAVGAPSHSPAHVTMDDTRRMRGGERARNLDADVEHLRSFIPPRPSSMP